MWTVYVKRGNSITSDSSKTPDTYVKMCGIGHSSYYFGKTSIFKKTNNPEWDINQQNPFYFPSILSNKLEFKIFEHRTILFDKFLGNCFLELDNISFGIDIQLNIDFVFLPDDICYLIVVILPPNQSIKRSPFNCDYKNLFISLSFDPPLKDKSFLNLIELSLFQISLYEGEIHHLTSNSIQEGLKTSSNMYFYTKGGFSPLFEIDLLLFSLEGTFGYKGKSDFVIIPCIFNRSDYIGTIFLDIYGTYKLSSLDKKYSYYHSKDLINYFSLLEQKPFQIENKGLYSGGILIDNKYEIINHSFIYSSDGQIPNLINDLSKSILPIGVNKWTRLISTQEIPINLSMACAFQRVLIPKKIKFEIGWKKYIYDIKLKLIPYDENLNLIKLKFWNKINGIKENHPWGSDDKVRKIDNEKITFLIPEIDPKFKYFVLTLSSYYEKFDEIEGLYLRIINKDLKIELSFTPINFHNNSMILGIFYQISLEKWEFKPLFLFPDSINEKDINLSSILKN